MPALWVAGMPVLYGAQGTLIRQKGSAKCDEEPRNRESEGYRVNHDATRTWNQKEHKTGGGGGWPTRKDSHTLDALVDRMRRLFIFVRAASRSFA